MVINTGMRTDIPAFYSKWFMNRIKEGFVYVKNPYNPKIIIKFSLNPQVVDCIDFCTKNPEPMLKYLDDLKDYNMLWYVTITPYDYSIEPNVLDKDIVIESFKKLVEKLPNSFVGWRYDPIFFNKDYGLKRHIKEFEYIAKKLKGYTDTCVISFIDLYDKVKKNAPDLIRPSEEAQIILAKEFCRIGKENNIKIYACCEKDYLSKYGVICTGCKSKEIVRKSISYDLEVPPNTKNIRVGCSCLMGNDIGAYNTCKHLCKYCYANTSKEKVIENTKKYNENSPILCDEIKPFNKLAVANQHSYRKTSEQMSMF